METDAPLRSRRLFNHLLQNLRDDLDLVVMQLDGFSELRELLHELAQRYIGPGTEFPPMPNPPAGFIIRVTPARVRGMGPWAEGR